LAQFLPYKTITNEFIFKKDIMQVIMYTRRQYDGNLIQQIHNALQVEWPYEELDLVLIFDISSSFLIEMPTMVRIFTPKNNPNSTTMSNLVSPVKSSHYDAIHLFQHFESRQKSQLIFIEKKADSMNIGIKIVKQLLGTFSSLLPSRRDLPSPLKFLEDAFSIFYQNNSGKNSADSIFKSNTNSVSGLPGLFDVARH